MKKSGIYPLPEDKSYIFAKTNNLISVLNKTYHMKSRFTRVLMAGLLACGLPPAVHAQTDVTDTYVKNPSFENGLTDWTSESMVAQTNDKFTLKDGTTYVEKWTDRGQVVGNASISQELEDVPNGVYRLTVATHNIQQESASNHQRGAYIFADDAQTAVTTTQDYSLEFTVIEGQATIGFKAENATGNWLCCDNFRLYSISQDVALIHQELQQRIDEARELVSERMQKDVLTELNAAIAAAQQEVSSETDENTAEVAIRLREAAEAAQVSIQAYGNLQTAIDQALDVYGDGNMEGAAEFDAAIKAAQAALENQEMGLDDLAAAVTELEAAQLAFLMANASGTAPTVVTDTRYARGATMAFGRSTVSGVATSDLLEQGFCWSTEPEPTVLDNRTTEYLDNNGRIYVMRDLQPATIYYIRAYAMTKDYAVGYGNAIKVITIPKGSITWWYNNGGAADANERINSAVASAVDYWNNLTSIQGLHLTVSYGAQTPTADCSYGGSMRVGPNASYQQTGTIMHEMGHAIGVGTHSTWNGSNSPLRAGSGTGDWLGDRANEVVRFWDNDPTATLTGDKTHMWPYGINGAHEDNRTETLYLANGLITQALGEDGLPPTGGFCTPTYVFEQEDQVKYYLKNESESNGLYTSYLVANGLSISNKEMTAAEAAADDNAAWYITFNPQTCYYQFRNVATGSYLTYNTTRSNFAMTRRETPTTTENFHLMRGRVDVKLGQEGNAITTRGYWIIHPENTASPKSMSASLGTLISAATFNLGDAAENQRWVIVPEDELTALENAITSSRHTELEEMLAHIKALMETPHTEDVAGTDATLANKLAEIEGKADQEGITSNELADLTEEALTAGMDFLAEATPESAEQPFDITFLLSDAGLTDATGWSTTPDIAYSCGEFFQQTFDFYQTVSGLPGGTYQFKGQGFQRPGSTAAVYNAYINGDNNVSAVIYAGSDEALLQNIIAEAQEKSLGNGETTVGSNPTLYVPNDKESASNYFAAGLYDNGVVTELANDNSRLKVGMRCTESGTSYWSIFDNFRLHYYGSMTKDQITDIRQTMADKAQGEGLFARPADIYSLSGICIRRQATSLDGLPQGIYIVNGHKILVR